MLFLKKKKEKKARLRTSLWRVLLTLKNAEEAQSHEKANANSGSIKVFFFFLDKHYLFLLSDVKFHLCNVWKDSCSKNAV